uniref:NADH-ubiquinone oxidoreductase chain 1 n=2 Tax=unclassified Megaspilidae TaxID=1253067 RepID=A0A3Q8UA68_9HYME|nr:NADH dehydrogenase subunit 1 [Megaspilidae sp. SJW-2015]AZL93346.1 NADH dehydrogenase subunit 1 [Megaspilidae sp. ZJUH_2016022]
MNFILCNLWVCMIYLLMVIVSVLVTLAFLTLLERKLLGLIQLRKGPNKVGIWGILQPFSDAVKLFIKENNNLFKFNKFMYLVAPLVMIYFMLVLWMSLASVMNFLFLDLSLLFMFVILGLGGYPIMLSGWASKSIYSLLGSLRAIVQSISYEISFIMLVLILVLLTSEFTLISMINYQKFFKFFLFLGVVMIMFFVSVLAELNRTPFDFAEGESELVSGFNVEYMGGEFAFIFMAEYGMIVFMSFWVVSMYMMSNVFSVIFYIFVILLSFLIIWVRGVFPRFRYDSMMYLIWKNYLPLVLYLFIYYYSLKFFMFYMLF